VPSGQTRSLSARVRDKVTNAGSAGSIASSLRAKRWKRFVELFPGISEMRVLDLGGTAASWAAAPVRPAELVLLNLVAQPHDQPWIISIVGDVCALPADLARQRFDVVYSNSVIEHVGGHSRRMDMAHVVHSMADRHWVQTPYRYFPLEPHWTFPGMQFLPTTLRAKVAMKWPLAWTKAPDYRSAVNAALEIDLLDRTQMRYYFPDSDFLTESVAGLPKSLIATR
jgi:hypothetical protein